ncbi:MAG: methionyl-tRNA formyltransferase [Bacteroidota bacterium]|nr:methionyl-tRNA formyltransferase [Bacteroidota bacterium]
MGTPDFAIASLDALVNDGCNIVGVITSPDRPAGRGMKLQPSVVKQYAVDKKLNVLQPEKLKNPEFIQELKALHADLQIVVAFRMLPEVVWNMPLMGTINVHGSLLPQYRGAAPINWVIINGESETGVTTFKLKHEIDTGDILLQEKVSIGERETAGELHDKMKEMGAALLVKTIKGLANGMLKETPQPEIRNQKLEIGDQNTHSPLTIHYSSLKYAPKITTETCRIDWNKPVTEVYNLVRGLSPYPAAFTELNGKKLKVFSAEKEMAKPVVLPGDYQTDGKTFLKYACLDGFLQIKELQLEGKKRMFVKEFLRGFRIIE